MLLELPQVGSSSFLWSIKRCARVGSTRGSDRIKIFC